MGALKITFKKQMSEADLLEGCLNSDRMAQKRLFDQYKDAMFTLAYRITNDFNVAEDVLQEGFLSVFKNIAQFRKDSTLGAWIKTIIVRRALRLKKKNQKYQFSEELSDNYDDKMIDWGTSLDTEYLETAIQSLSTGYRTVFILIEIEGYSHREVAEMLGISEGTSKSQLYHSKKKLRSILKNQF